MTDACVHLLKEDLEAVAFLSHSLGRRHEVVGGKVQVPIVLHHSHKPQVLRTSKHASLGDRVAAGESQRVGGESHRIAAGK